MWFKASQYLKKMGGIIMIASILIWALGHFPVPKATDGKSISTTVVSENSYIGRIGKFIEPAIRPLGFDWSMGICLLTGVAAKEIVVSTMGVIYHSENGNADLVKKIQNAKQFTPLATLSFLMFTLLYFPCIATIAAIRSESGSWRWAVFSVLFSTGLAWIASFLFYQTGLLLI
jgi:ferrous iron transport protein B